MKTYDAEKQMLRELAWWVLPQLKCFFCDQPILDIPDNSVSFGHRRHNKVEAKFTIHHKDEDRSNNFRANVPIAHPDCHKQHHAVKSGFRIQRIGTNVHQTGGKSSQSNFVPAEKGVGGVKREDSKK